MARPAHLAALVVAVALAGCSSPCKDLGDRLCRCTPAGTSRDTCERQVDEQLDRIDPTEDEQDHCEAVLASCNEPDGARFCEWLDTSCGKSRCGLSEEPPETACAVE